MTQAQGQNSGAPSNSGGILVQRANRVGMSGSLGNIPKVQYPLGQNASLSSHLKVVIDSCNLYYQQRTEVATQELSKVKSNLNSHLQHDPRDLLAIVRNSPDL